MNNFQYYFFGIGTFARKMAIFEILIFLNQAGKAQNTLTLNDESMKVVVSISNILDQYTVKRIFSKKELVKAWRAS